MSPEEFKSARRALGVKQKEIAKILGVTSRHVQRWERGDTRVPVVVDRLMQVYLHQPRLFAIASAD